MLIELVAAVCIAKINESLVLNFMGKRIITQKLFIKVIVIWQLLIFVQITVGLIRLPLLVLMFISPACVLLITGGIILLFTLLIFILMTIPFPTSCKYQPRRIMQSFLYTAETILIAALFISAYMTYYIFDCQEWNEYGWSQRLHHVSDPYYPNFHLCLDYHNEGSWRKGKEDEEVEKAKDQERRQSPN